jgi:sialic acid synthase
MANVNIDGIEIASSNDYAYVIAEIGNNHQGDVDVAKEMFRVAKECGVDAVKLQKRDNRSLYTKKLFNQVYDNPNSFGKTYGEHRDYLEFGKDEYVELKQYAEELGIAMFATAFDFNSADFLAELDMPAYKIASGDLTSIPLLEHVARIGKPIILSTGGGEVDDIVRAYEAIMPINPQLCLLQCTAAYPASFDTLNLRVISAFTEKFPKAVIGLSDHENGIAMALVAYVLGARVFEKHFTLNHTSKGTDHAFSLEPAGMRKLVRDLRRIPLALGSTTKEVYDMEKAPIRKMGKSIYSAQPLPVGHELTHEDLLFRSPGDGIPLYELENIVGRTLKTALPEEEPILFEHLV